MSIVVIVVIVAVVALVLIGVFLLLPRLREGARVKKRERELHQRRKQVIGENREEGRGSGAAGRGGRAPSAYS